MLRRCGSHGRRCWDCRFCTILSRRPLYSWEAHPHVPGWAGLGQLQLHLLGAAVR